MNTLSEWFHSGRIVDVILLITLGEAALLTVLYHWRRQGVAPWEYLLNLLSGLCLMLALRAALQHEPWTWVALWLACSGVAHVSDMARRWQR